LNGKNPCEEQTAGACKNDVTLEMVMTELATMKTLLTKVIANHEVSVSPYLVFWFKLCIFLLKFQ
jgi:hypothetical protein